MAKFEKQKYKIGTLVELSAAGAKADQNIAEFKKRFHEELSRQFGIEYEDEVLDVDRKNTAAGVKSQGWKIEI